MQQFLLILLAVVAGVLLAVQAPLNSALGANMRSPFLGALASFVTGGVALLLLCLLLPTPLSAFREGLKLPWYYWLGGIFGAVYVVGIIVLAPRLGVALTFGLTVGSQLIFGLVLDHFGWLNIPQEPISWVRVIGVLLIIGGVLLVRG